MAARPRQGTWTRRAKLTATDAAANDNFGYSLSVDGDTAVIGAYDNDDGGSSSGSAYVYVGAPIPVELQSFTLD